MSTELIKSALGQQKLICFGCSTVMKEMRSKSICISFHLLSFVVVVLDKKGSGALEVQQQILFFSKAVP